MDRTGLHARQPAGTSWGRPPAGSVHARTSAHRVLALTALLWLNAGCATQEQLVDPFPGAADVTATKVDRAVPGAGRGASASAPDRPSERPSERSSEKAPAMAPASEVDQATIERLLAEAEHAYEGARWGQALEAYKAVTTFDPGNPQAWLRIGNLHQRRGHLLAAASAYRKAGSGAQGEARIKALVNLASVNLELAGAALDEARALAGEGVDVTSSAREALGAELAGQADALERFSRARPWAARKDPGEEQPMIRAREPGARIRPPARWSASDRPAEAGRAADRGAQAPERGQPARSAPAQPSIEYLRGAPRS